jgi:ABC-type nitrate/sulfonate/bicarbonate transport system permease component
VGSTAAIAAVAMTLGSVIGLIMDRSRIADQFGDSWLIVLLNLLALVIMAMMKATATRA